MKLPLKILLLSLLLLAAMPSAATAQIKTSSIGTVRDMADSGRILKSRATIEVTADGYIKATVKYADGSAVEGKPIAFFVFNGQEKESGYAASSDEQGAAVFEIQPGSLNNRTVKIKLFFLDSQTFDRDEKELGEVVFDEQGKVAEIKYATAKKEKSDRKKRPQK